MKTQGKRSPHIVVLDADPAILDYVHRILADRFSVGLFTEAAELNRSLRESPTPDLLLMDWHIAENETEENALGLLAKIRASKPSLPIIMLACSAELKEVVVATRMGAADVILKPFRKSDIDLAVQQCLKESGKPPADPDIQGIPLDENTSFVRSSKRMREIESQCALVARADIPVLILGESGTGKEVAAMLIHKMSARNQRCFLKVNCAAMPADLLESELFGYEQGAFTGAVKSKPGKFEICNNGTILLDEIGEMPSALQAKLLQVLQDGSFSRLGGRSSVKVDVRVIAATNIDIKAAIAQRTFREDLYYRLNGFTLRMPPLRERTEEIPILAQHFMCKAAAQYECDPLPISPALMQALTSHVWPGNLRELENTIKRYLVLGDEQAIIDELCPLQSTASFALSAEDFGGSANLKHLVRNLKGSAESAAIAQSLEGTGWNRKAAANDLQISYKALLYKIKQYNLSPPQKRQVSMGQAAGFDQAQSA
ncbi:MAG: sigma-54 dependent transcriptional regulator [Terracidiphilus sp.]|jgi:DNA-binding NtrC family response regulator